MKKNFFIKFFMLFTCSLIIFVSCGKSDKDSTVQVDDNLVEVDLNTFISSAEYSKSEENLYSYEIVNLNIPENSFFQENNDFFNYGNGKIGVLSTLYSDGKNELLYSEISKNDIKNSVLLKLPDTDVYISASEKKLLESDETASLTISESYNNLYINENNIIGLDNIYYYCFSTSTGESAYSYVTLICSWSHDGELLFSKKLSTDESTNLIVYNSFDSNSKYSIIICDSEGEYKAFSYNSNSSDIISMSVDDAEFILGINDVIETDTNDLIAFYKDSDGLTKASYFDIDNLKLGTEITLPDYITLNGYSGVSFYDSDKFIFSNYLGVYFYNVNSGSFEKIMDYVNSDFDGYYIDDVNYNDDDSFYGVYTSFDGSSENIAYFEMTDNRNEDKAIVVLGTYNLAANTRKQILNYNISDNSYRVIINDYSIESTLDNPDFGYDVMENEILNGEGPDFIVIDPGEIDVNKMADNNDLVSWNYLCSLDDEISNSVYLTNVLDAYSVNGYDYIFVYDFIYKTYLGNSDIIGSTGKLDIKNFKKKVSNNSDVILYTGITQTNYLENLIKYDAADYIDTASNTSEFNCDDFISLLEYAKNLPSESETDLELTEDELYRNGGIILKEKNIIAADGFWEDAYRYFDGNAVLTGFPGNSAYTSIIEFVDYPFMIMSNGNISGAWDFIKTFYSLEYQSEITNAIPVNTYAFDKWGEDTLYNSHFSSYASSGESVYLKKTYYYDGQEYEIPFIESDNIDKIKNTIKSTKKCAFYDDVIYNIIWDEAEEYFAGNQSAKQAAKNMDEEITAVLQGS